MLPPVPVMRHTFPESRSDIRLLSPFTPIL
jgi:hypothetical protein